MSDLDPIDALVADAHASLSRARAAVPPDFAAVLARARDQSENDAMAASMPAESEDGCDPVVDIRSRARVGGAPDGLDGLVGDAREALDRMIEGTGMRAIPPLPRVLPLLRSTTTWRRPLALVAGVSALAAAAAIVFAMVRWSAPVELTEPTAPLDQAFRIAADTATDGLAIEEVEPAPSPPRRAVVQPSLPIVEPPLPVPAPLPVPEVRTPAPRIDGDRLRSLSEEARALWRAGDRAGAEAKFLEVTASGGRKALAELAWGDLFALAHQLGDDARLAKRWRAYLGKFPRGRYADDARAGLCRTSATPATCWRAYLVDFPRGSYRAEADAADGQGAR